jgi:hypothetical protein
VSRADRHGCQAVLVILSDRLLWALVRDGAPLAGGLISEPWCSAEGAGQEALDVPLGRLKARLDASQLGQASVLRVAVAESRLAGTLLPWAQGVWRMSQAREAWRAGLQAAGWAVHADDSVVAQDAPHGQPRWVAAWDAATLTALEGFAEACGWRLASVRPMGAVLRAALPPPASDDPRLLAVLDDACVILYLVGRHTLDVLVRPRPQPMHGTDNLATAVQAQLCRQQLRRADWAQAQAVSWVNAAQATADLGPGWKAVLASHPSLDGFMGLMGRSAGWRHDPMDAVSVSGPAWGAVRAVLALTLLAAATLGVHGLWVRQPAAPVASTAPSQTTVASALTPSSGAAASDRREVQAGNNAIALLNLPVSRVLDALQPPRDLPVALLSLDLAAAAQGASLRVVGEATQPADMFHYVDHLQLHAPLNAARLVQHERRPSSEGATPALHRFTVEATWQP